MAQGYRDRLGKHEETSGETMADQHVIEPHFYKDMSEEEIGENMNEAAKWAEQRIFDQGKMKYLYEDGSMLIHDEDRVRAVQKQPGHMYEVHINAHPHHMLDWDKDVSEQHPHILNAINKMIPKDEEHRGGLREFVENPDDYAGGAIIDYLHGAYGAKKTSEMLHGAGIKGIKYLDAGSRSDKAKQTHNYVVFDHNDVGIKRKYEQGGRVGFDGGGDVDGITALHSSPHDFEQFDISKIGTGEGNQSYGHGLYFSENPSVSGQGGSYWNQFWNKMKSGPERNAATALWATKFDRDKSIESLMKEHAYHTDQAIPGRYGNGPELEEGSRLLADEYKQAADLLKSGAIAGPRTYEVHINAHPDHFLNYDKPLSEQSEHVRAAFKGHNEDDTGREIQRTSKYWFDGPEKDNETLEERESRALQSKGIKGIKYLDSGSRGKDGKPTYNYVVFDHNDVHIKRKYEQGGRVGFDDGGSVYDKFLPHNHPQRQQNLGEFMRESAVKHPDGRPKVVYHNTSRSFNEFRTAKSEMGAHFGTPAQANDILEVIHDQPDHQGYPVYLNLKNPLRLRDTGSFDPYRIHRQLKEMGLAEGLPKNPHQLEMQEHLQSLGYDGVVYLNRREGISRAKGKDPERYNDYSDQMFKHHFPDAEDSYIAFDPTQIKSAIGNNGYYDPNIPRIDEHTGGEVNGYDNGGVIPHNDMQRDDNLGKFLQRSRVRNGDGDHVILYHITPKNFDTFKAGGDDPELSGPGIWLSPNKNHLPAAHNVGGGQRGYVAGTNVMPVYASIKSPLVLDTPQMLDWARKSYGAGGQFPLYLHPEVKQKLIEDGYDGIFYAGEKGIDYAANNIGIGEQPHSEEEVIAFHPHQIKSAIGNNGNFDPNSPRVNEHTGGGVNGFAEGGDVWDDSRVRRSGEGGTETALDFIQNAPLYKQRMEAQAPQPAPVAAPSTEAKSMPVTAGPPPTPPAIVQPAQPVQQKQEAPQAQGQVGLYAVGTNDPNPDMTVQSAQRIIESSRAMGINPVFLLPNQAGGTQYAKNSKALQDYLDSVGIQYQMPQYGDKDPLHMTPGWASGAAKSYQAPFLAGDSNSVRMGIVGYGAKGDGKTIVHPESGAVLGRVGANSKAVADELERHLEWKQRNRTERNTGGPVNASKGQDTAGNFKKEHEKIHGVPVAIEVKEGHDRVKYKPDGSLKFKAKQYADYGAILGTKDADGMNTDVMVGPHKDSDKAYIIDQRKHSTGKFDEHKVMLGFNKRKKAIKAYTKSYADRHGKDRVQDVVKTDIAGLKKWLKHGNLKVAAAKDALINRALEVVSKKT